MTDSPPTIPRRLMRRPGALFAAVLLLAFALRMILILHSQRYLRSDEALVGVIALDIMEGNGIPAFPYNNPYGGGHIVEALMAIPFLALFDASDVIITSMSALMGCGIMVVTWFLVSRILGRREALLTSVLLACSCTFVAFNVNVNGGMTTMFFGTAGLWLFLEDYLSPRRRAWLMLCSGILFGLAWWGFDYALFLPIGALGLLYARDGFRLARWKHSLPWLAGIPLGAMPLLVYNFTHDFANFRNLLGRASSGAPPDAEAPLFVTRFASKLVTFVTADLPASFTKEVYDYPESIPLWAYGGAALTLLLFAYILVDQRRGLIPAARLFVSPFRLGVLPPENRILYFLWFTALYIGIVCATGAGGKALRYLIPLYPLVPILLAWSLMRVSELSRPAARVLAILFLLAQIPALAGLYNDRSTREWKISTDGRGIAQLAAFLDAEGIDTVATPYEIKWKLMLETRKRIVCAAYMFGFDRETRYNLEVADRVNRRRERFAFIFDKEFRIPRIALNFNPRGAFDVDLFHEFLDRRGITWKTARVGEDYLVYYDFSPPFNLPEPPRPGGR